MFLLNMLYFYDVAVNIATINHIAALAFQGVSRESRARSEPWVRWPPFISDELVMPRAGRVCITLSFHAPFLLRSTWKPLGFVAFLNTNFHKLKIQNGKSLACIISMNFAVWISLDILRVFINITTLFGSFLCCNLSVAAAEREVKVATESCVSLFEGWGKMVRMFSPHFSPRESICSTLTLCGCYQF